MPNLANNKKSIAAVAVALVAVMGLLLYYEYGPGSGLRALQASQQALREAKSWRSETLIPLDTASSMVGRSREIVCPSEFVDSYAEASNLEAVGRRAYVHGVWYNQQPDGTWIVRPGQPQRQVECGKGPIADGIFLYPGLDRAERSGDVRQGDRAQTAHGSCIWWDVSTAPGAGTYYSVCLQRFSHLPLQIKFSSSGNTYSYWDWNRTSLTPPVVTSPAAE
jgi:hypothetical protein